MYLPHGSALACTRWRQPGEFMPRLTIGSRLAAALLLIAGGLAAGCNDSTTTPTTPTNPVTETLTGTITQNGVNVQPFNAAAAGTVTATITTLAPVSTTT